jgi:hypothetical protein
MGKKSTKKAPAKKKPLAGKIKEQITGKPEDANEAAPRKVADMAGRDVTPPVGNKTLQALADMLIAEVGRMRIDTVPTDVQSAIRALQKWRSK